jgi:hypothetical protein
MSENLYESGTTSNGPFVNRRRVLGSLDQRRTIPAVNCRRVREAWSLLFVQKITFLTLCLKKDHFSSSQGRNARLLL